ncbi:MAG: mechanosensitive ion channel family protein [Candidatus Cyclobacteriaceae bacterium M2_1C_046]
MTNNRGTNYSSNPQGRGNKRGARLTDHRDKRYKKPVTKRGHRVVKRRTRGRAVKGAQNQLKKFRQGTILAVALTGFLLLLFTPEEAGYSQEQPQQEITDTTQREREETKAREDIPDTVSIIEDIAVEDLVTTQEVIEEDTATIEGAGDIGKAAKTEAVETLSNLWEGFYANLPKLLVAIAILLITWLFVRLLKFIVSRTSRKTQSRGATNTIIVICIWLFAIGLAISVVAGDIRALVGSLGLIGLALSWSLQTPIESFTGWLLNSFRGYYRVGDRISVGDVFGDVYKIDFLTTTVWEIGAPFRQGFVQAEQPTGRLVTFPNNEILTGTVVNLTGDFPFVWDELAIGVAHESDMRKAMAVLEKTATDLLGDYMKEPSQKYYRTLQRSGLDYAVPEKPQVFLAIGESWTDVIIRYLVGARERRKWKTELSLRVIEELNKSEHKGKIKPVYPRQQVQFIRPDGMPEEPGRISRE